MEDHTRCQHSQWLATLVPPEVRAGPAFRQLEEPHARVHALAKQVLEAHEASDRAAALATLTELRDANAEFFRAIDALSDELKQHEAAGQRGDVAA
jgi:methyl-accepting chemotaxis protein